MTTQSSDGFGATVDRSRAVLHGARLSQDDDHHRARERRKAALFVAGQARDVDDCRELLEALGLIDGGVRWERSITNYGTNSRSRKVQQ